MSGPRSSGRLFSGCFSPEGGDGGACAAGPLDAPPPSSSSGCEAADLASRLGGLSIGATATLSIQRARAGPTACPRPADKSGGAGGSAASLDGSGRGGRRFFHNRTSPATVLLASPPESGASTPTSAGSPPATPGGGDGGGPLDPLPGAGLPPPSGYRRLWQSISGAGGGAAGGLCGAGTARCIAPAFPRH